MNPVPPTPPPAPLHCRPEAFDTLARSLEAVDTTRGLVRCAVAVSMHQHPDADADAVERELQRLSQTIADRTQSDHPPALLAHAHAVLFDEAGFAGNTDDYYHPDNSYLHRVLDTKRGLPITLTLVYKAVLEPLGLRVRGVNAPGHFLAAVHDRDHGPPTLIDPFHGGKLLTREEAFTRIETVAGGAVVRDDALLPPARHDTWLVRLIQNLVGSFDRLGRRDDMAALNELKALARSIG
ncbi:MAG: transglutaminase-like domain-containing protein [Planctomycetota bacterium]